MTKVKKQLAGPLLLLALVVCGLPLQAETEPGTCADPLPPGLEEADLPRPFAIGSDSGGAGAELDPVDQVGD